MTAANKARGTRFESEVADYLQGQGVRAKRLPRTGAKDIGDVAFSMWAPATEQHVNIVLEAKNRKAMDLPTWIAESETEASNYAERYPAEGVAIPLVVHKRRGKGAHQAYVTCSLDTLVDLLREVGAL